MVFPIHSQCILGLVFFIQISISRWWFFVHMRHFEIAFLFLIFDLIFLRNAFSNSLIVRSRFCFLFSQ